MSLTKKGTAWVLVPRLCLHFTSEHKIYKHYLIPSTTFPLQEKNDLCSVLWEKRYFQKHSLDVHPLNHQASSWARCLNLRGWLELDTVFCTFAFSTSLLTILKHLLAQHVSPSETPPSLHASPRTPRHSAFEFWIPLCSQTKVTILTSIADLCYLRKKSFALSRK